MMLPKPDGGTNGNGGVVVSHEGGKIFIEDVHPRDDVSQARCAVQEEDLDANGQHCGKAQD